MIHVSVSQAEGLDAIETAEQVVDASRRQLAG